MKGKHDRENHPTYNHGVREIEGTQAGSLKRQWSKGLFARFCFWKSLTYFLTISTKSTHQFWEPHEILHWHRTYMETWISSLLTPISLWNLFLCIHIFNDDKNMLLWNFIPILKYCSYLSNIELVCNIIYYFSFQCWFKIAEIIKCWNVQIYSSVKMC